MLPMRNPLARLWSSPADWAHRLVALFVAALVLLTVPHRLVGRSAEARHRGDLTEIEPLADQVATAVLSGVGSDDFSTGDPRFDGEWAVATNQMAVLGLGQLLLAHPDRKDLAERWLPAIRAASETLLSVRTRRFATSAWSSDAVASLESTESRDAWLGYVALALSVHRRVDPAFPHTQIHDRLIRSLRGRIEAGPDGLYATYPGEIYPVDVTATIAAIAQHAEATGSRQSVRPFIDAWAEKFAADWIDPSSGYLIQTVGGEPRGSGTALAAYFLGFAHEPTARLLYEGLLRSGVRTVAGFTTVREYPTGVAGSGDIDSGPVIFGASVSATGFALASARRNTDARSRDVFVGIYRTAELFGMPYGLTGGLGNTAGYAVGGLIGDALLLAMQTAIAQPEAQR
jgi:hypothetical protein